MSQNSNFDVIVCGSLHLDIIVKAHALPRIDETAVGSAWMKVCGGKGGNQAVQAARAGASTAMIGCVGDDEFGQTLCENLEAAGVDCSAIAKNATLGSGMSVAILQDNGDYGAVIVSGANKAMDPAALPVSWNALGGAKALVLQNEIPHSANIAAARTARQAGALVVFNAAPVRSGVDDLLEFVDVLILNRVEAEAYLGAPVAGRAPARALLSRKAGRGPAVIVTLGGDGLLVAEKSGEISEIAPVSVRVVSTHGAGDCFTGALAAELARGRPLHDACIFANQQAAALVSQAR